MNQSRRTFLKLAVGGAATATVNSAGCAQLAETQTTSLSQHQPRWAMVIDLRKCIGCQACTVACSMENLVPLGQFRTIVSTYEVDVTGDPRRVTLPRLCNHCENPPCVEVCPTQATYKREDGIVVVDNTVCIGCGYCVQGCPYDARFINSEIHTVDKCTFCVHRVDAGLLLADLFLQALWLLVEVGFGVRNGQIAGRFIFQEHLTTFIVVGIAGTTLLPMLLLVPPSLRREGGSLLPASLLATTGAWVFRWNVVIGGQEIPKTSAGFYSYVPALTGHDSLLNVVANIAFAFFLLLVLTWLLLTGEMQGESRGPATTRTNETVVKGIMG